MTKADGSGYLIGVFLFGLGVYLLFEIQVAVAVLLMIIGLGFMAAESKRRKDKLFDTLLDYLKKVLRIN